MRALTLTAFAVLVALNHGSALAASGCNKGMLWPYVREPGDCLTDDEVKAGQKGVYNGPVNTNPDMSNVKVETPPASSIESGSSGFLSGILGSRSTSSGSTTTAPNSNGPAMNGPGFAPPPPPRSADASCSKGWLWPFVRKPGDCLTEVERQRPGGEQVYRADQVVASATPASASTGTQRSGSGGADGSATPAGTEPPPASTEPACRKGWLWPFVRRPGDCPTEAERRSGR